MHLSQDLGTSLCFSASAGDIPFSHRFWLWVVGCRRVRLCITTASTYLARHLAHACEALFFFAREGLAGFGVPMIESFDIALVELDVISFPIAVVGAGLSESPRTPRTPPF